MPVGAYGESVPVLQVDGAGNEVAQPALVNGGVPVTLTGAPALTEGTALASAARTAVADSLDIANTGRGLMLVVKITVNAGSSVVLTPILKWKDPVTGDYNTIWTAAATISTVGTYLYMLHPDATDLGAIFKETVRLPVPKTVQLEIGVGGVAPATYSVGYSTLN